MTLRANIEQCWRLYRTIYRTISEYGETCGTGVYQYRKPLTIPHPMPHALLRRLSALSPRRASASCTMYKVHIACCGIVPVGFFRTRLRKACPVDFRSLRDSSASLCIAGVAVRCAASCTNLLHSWIQMFLSSSLYTFSHYAITPRTEADKFGPFGCKRLQSILWQPRG